mmetsp:Transcript_18949/g.43975  ORF Transcript_18949/g.43975 Transcript_18949/m.43975 type:complete len:127 (-) Transcript_18949:428-808(-)
MRSHLSQELPSRMAGSAADLSYLPWRYIRHGSTAETARTEQRARTGRAGRTEPRSRTGPARRRGRDHQRRRNNGGWKNDRRQRVNFRSGSRMLQTQIGGAGEQRNDDDDDDDDDEDAVTDLYAKSM